MKIRAKRITTKKVQYWKNGIMITAQMSQKMAQALVAQGKAYIINDQAIGAIIDGKKAG